MVTSNNLITLRPPTWVLCWAFSSHRVGLGKRHYFSSWGCFPPERLKKFPYFYNLLKVHKYLNLQGCPIVAAMESVTSGFSIYIDQFLQPLAQSLHYNRDGIHLLDTLQSYPWESAYMWVSWCSIPLYFHPPQSRFKSDWMLSGRRPPLPIPNRQSQVCLKHNYFQFNGTCVHINRTAMPILHPVTPTLLWGIGSPCTLLKTILSYNTWSSMAGT